jgi:hypothetical protein
MFADASFLRELVYLYSQDFVAYNMYSSLNPFYRDHMLSASKCGDVNEILLWRLRDCEGLILL